MLLVRWWASHLTARQTRPQTRVPLPDQRAGSTPVAVHRSQSLLLLLALPRPQVGGQHHRLVTGEHLVHLL